MKTHETILSVCTLVASLFLLVQPAAGGAAQADVTGTWKGNGEDKRSVKWEFTFTLTQKGDVLEGEGQWVGSDGTTSTSKMKGKINVAKKTFTLKDVSLENVSGDALAATYSGSFLEDFKKMKGKWTIPHGSPGTFEALKEP